MTLDTNDRNDLVELLVQRQLGEFFQWERPRIGLTIGPCNTDLFIPFEVALAELTETTRASLGQLGNNELISLKLQNAEKRNEFNNNWMATYLEELKALMPSDAAVGFGHPNLRADFIYWGKMQHFTIHEALALSVGVEPEHLPEEKVAALLERSSKKMELLPAHVFLVRRFEQFRRFFKFMGARFMRESPLALKRWFDEVRMEVHPEFYAQLEHRCAPVALEKPAERPIELALSERETLLKLIAAMSCEQYGFNPNATRSTTVSSIQADLASVGQHLDNKTILKWLREASKIVENQYFSNED